MNKPVLLLGLAALGIVSLAGCASDRAPGASSTEFGYAIQCPKPKDGRGELALKPGEVRQAYDLCLQPDKVTYENRPAKLIWGQTAPLGPVIAELHQDESGKPVLEATGGRDTYQMTLQFGSERLAVLQSVRGLEAKANTASSVINTSTNFDGEIVVPPLRGLGYTDSRGRGTDYGYDASNATVADSGEQFDKATEISRNREVGEGTIEFRVTSVNPETGEIAGRFKARQTSGVAVHEGELDIEGDFIGTFKPKKGGES